MFIIPVNFTSPLPSFFGGSGSNVVWDINHLVRTTNVLLIEEWQGEKAIPDLEWACSSEEAMAPPRLNGTKIINLLLDGWLVSLGYNAMLRFHH